MTTVSQGRLPVLILAKWGEGPELFTSVQGEGRSVGRPCVFLRLSLCNLHCLWCDTDYTWNWQGTAFRHIRDDQPGYHKFQRADEIVELPIDDVGERLLNVPHRRLVLTGGEPLLQQDKLVLLLEWLDYRSPGWTVEVETNGTIIPSRDFDYFITQYNVSPKLENSGNPEHLRHRPEALAALAGNPKADFKFVAMRPDDFTEIDQVVQQYEIAPSRVWVMPEGSSPAELDERLKWIAPECIRRGYAVSDRLHIRIWGSQRGV